eukprot:TRINITY_DN3317_c0_g1_i2.p1 TRINITY_DN3317_c0_g1~~TRINITY_DN3317_c0_g1_i2.p1  ORF type:complete len:334 (+),score=56.00 TRINITY_DN3317_c0_g1_i2:331-1332(+)
MSSSSSKSNEGSIPPLLIEKHVSFIQALASKKDTFEYWATEHLRMSGIYWGMGALYILSSIDKLDKKEIIPWILKCEHSEGGFGGNIGHDPHLLYTLSALQILAEFDSLDLMQHKEATIKFLSSLQQPDGSFVGDKWKEVDTRFSYCAIYSLRLLNALHTIDSDKAVEHIQKCRNFDGAFGTIPGAESHAGMTFCCVAALAILGRLYPTIDPDLLGWWLAERQKPHGGLCGRPEKSADVCYSWWVLSSLSIINRLHWIDNDKLKDWILQCQDTETGGIADKPGDLPDVFHTFFGVAGLSLMGYFSLPLIDPTYALPVNTLKRLGYELPWHKDS